MNPRRMSAAQARKLGISEQEWLRERKYGLSNGARKRWVVPRRAFLGSLAAAAMGCGGSSPTLPDPPPAPEPSPTPPPPPQWPLISFPLRAVGSNFVDAAGRQTWRWGAWDLYGSGWTQPTIRALSNPGVLQRLAEAGVNTVGMRPGPQSADGPDGYPCDAVLPAADATIASASSHGLAVEVALFDLWVIQHGYSCDPSWDFGDFQGDRLTPSQVAWLERLAPHTQDPVVQLLDGNEMFKARPKLEWFRDLKRHVRRLWPGKMLGTNTEQGSLQREADYVILHSDFPVGIQSGKPSGVNESGPDLSGEQWAEASQLARQAGTFFDLWRGDMDDEQWAEALRLHAEVRRASGR